MFDLSLAEIALIIIVAAIFIGPKELPVVVRAVAKTFRAMRGMTGELRKAFDDLAHESGLKDAAADIQRETRMIQGDDGTMYEAYHIPPPAGGRLGASTEALAKEEGGHYEPPPEQARPHPNPLPAGEGV